MFKECFSKVYLWEIYLFHSFEALQLWKTVCYTFQKWDGFGRKKERENSKAACCSSIEECKPNICGFEDHDKLHQKLGKWTYPHRGVNCNPVSVCVKETDRQTDGGKGQRSRPWADLFSCHSQIVRTEEGGDAKHFSNVLRSTTTTCTCALSWPQAPNRPPTHLIYHLPARSCMFRQELNTGSFIRKVSAVTDIQSYDYGMQI